MPEAEYLALLFIRAVLGLMAGAVLTLALCVVLILRRMFRRRKGKGSYGSDN